MGKKRKRPVKDNGGRREQKSPSKNGLRAFDPNGAPISDGPKYSHPVISLYYRQVLSLRQYILQRIPRSSKCRRRRIASVRQDGTVKTGSTGNCQTQELAHLLDTTLVGVWKDLPSACTQGRCQDLIAFTQSQYQSQLAGTDTGPSCPQSDIVDFVISALFNRSGFSYQRPEHLLTHGFQRPRENHSLPCSIPGVVARFHNRSAQMLKISPWTDVLSLLGSNGEEIMLRLLLDCGLFIAIDAKKGTYCQISGLPLSTLDPVPKLQTENLILTTAVTSVLLPPAKLKTIKPAVTTNETGLNTIFFCRRRMFYARPHFNSNGAIQFGLTNHMLNNSSSPDSLSRAVHILKYIFPRQFSLHNVFTVDPSGHDNAMPRDYTSREDEIARREELKRTQYQRHQLHRNVNNTEEGGRTRIPKRLRGGALELARQLQGRHKRCSYAELMRYYCSQERARPWKMSLPDTEPDGSHTGKPASLSSPPLITQPSVPRQAAERNTQVDQNPLITDPPNSGTVSPVVKAQLNLTDFATPSASVSAFCQAVIRNLIPPRFYGNGYHRISHQKIILNHVDRFIHMRRFESLSLHEVAHIPWLNPPNKGNDYSRNKLSLSDFQKRKELFYEFIYYLFDSILIPLIRGTFYVTESQTHRNRLFYFRHDVWRRLTTQPLATLKSSMFEELKLEDAQDVLRQRHLGYGSLRLLPKMAGVRPILNLRRRTMMEARWAGKTQRYLGSSVNSSIAPIQSMLNYEKTRRMDLIGSGMSSVGDIHTRLKAFKKSLLAGPKRNQQLPLYFVKLDIRSCFDTIPQLQLVRLIEKIVSEEVYHYMKYVEMKPANEFNGMWSSLGSESNKTRRRFGGRVVPMAKPEHVIDAIAKGSLSGKKNTVFIDTIRQNEYYSEKLLDLLDEHVRNNLVKIGKKYFRQRNGIPQGSVLSSLLCNFFYAEMEKNVLGFLDSSDTMLLRLVDDFLLITLNPDTAMLFLRAMTQGQPEYGVSVNTSKSLVNFAASVDGVQIPRLVDTSLFPYCGNLIDTRTLEIFKDQDRILEGGDSAAITLSDSLTLESTRAPGRTFHRKVLASVKLFMHPMYLDTTHNSHTAVLSNLYTNFVTSAMRMYRYMRSLPRHARPATGVVIRTICDVIQLGYGLVRARREQPHCDDESGDLLPPLICAISYFQVHYLAVAGFRFVLGRKQTQYPQVLHWLDLMLRETRLTSAGDITLLSKVVRDGNLTYGGWRF